MDITTPEEWSSRNYSCCSQKYRDGDDQYGNDVQDDDDEVVMMLRTSIQSRAAPSEPSW